MKNTLKSHSYEYPSNSSTIVLFQDFSALELILSLIHRPQLRTTRGNLYTFLYHSNNSQSTLTKYAKIFTNNNMGMGRRSTVHHCPKASKGNCRKGTGTDGMPICTKHQKNCTNKTRAGKVCNYPRIIEERCKGPCSR